MGRHNVQRFWDFTDRRIWLLVIFATVLVTRGPFVGVPLLSPDEANIAASADRLLDGGLLYRDASCQRGPLVYWIVTLPLALFGRFNMVAVRIVTMAFVAATAIAMTALIGSVSDRRAGHLAGLFFAVFSSTFIPGDFIATNSEPFVNFFVVLAFAAFVRSGFGAEAWGGLACGFLLGAATLTKQTALIFLPVPIVLILLDAGPAHMGGILKRAAFVIAGFCLPLLVVVAVYRAAGELATFVYYFWTYPGKNILGAAPLVEGVTQSLEKALVIALPNAYLWGMAILSIGRIGRRALPGLRAMIGSDDRRAPLGGIMLVLWSAAAFLGALSGMRPWGYYYLILIPPLCGLASLSVVEGSFRPFGTRFYFAKGKKARAAMVIGMVLPMILFSRNPVMMGLHEKVLGNRALEEVAAYISEGTQPHERIFMWGYVPGVYVLSRRSPATRYVNCMYLTGQTHGTPSYTDPSADTSDLIVPGAWDMLMRDFKETPPVYIIDSTGSNRIFWGRYPMEKYPRLYDFVLARYRLERSIDGYDLYRRIDE